jgi:hypothetical protein
MPVYGLPKTGTNPEFKDALFLMFFPNFKSYLSREVNKDKYNYFKSLANQRIFKSRFGTDWELGMSLCIAFYLGLVVEQENKGSQSLSKLADNLQPVGRVDSYSVGSLSKSMSFESVMLVSEEAMFWNQNDYGRRLFALAKTKGTLTMAVAI